MVYVAFFTADVVVLLNLLQQYSFCCIIYLYGKPIRRQPWLYQHFMMSDVLLYICQIHNTVGFTSLSSYSLVGTFHG